MSRDVLDRAFEPFFTTRSSGSGLGLSQVLGFVQQSAGEVRIESREGRGTTVRLLFPTTSGARRVQRWRTGPAGVRPVDASGASGGQLRAFKAASRPGTCCAPSTVSDEPRRSAPIGSKRLRPPAASPRPAAQVLGQERLDDGVGGDAVRRQTEAVALVRVEHVGDRQAARLGRRHDLVELGLLHARVVGALQDEQRPGDGVWPGSAASAPSSMARPASVRGSPMRRTRFS